MVNIFNIFKTKEEPKEENLFDIDSLNSGKVLYKLNIIEAGPPSEKENWLKLGWNEEQLNNELIFSKVIEQGFDVCDIGVNEVQLQIKQSPYIINRHDNIYQKEIKAKC